MFQVPCAPKACKVTSRNDLVAISYTYSVTELGRQLGFKQEDFVEETQLHSLELAKKDKS